MKTLQAIFFSCALVLAPAYAYSAGADDEKAIRDGIAQWEAAWNKHDAKMGSALFADDADFINVNASFWKGRPEIEEAHAKLFATIFKDSTFKAIDTSVRFVTQDVALAHVKWEISGDKNPDGTPRQPRQGIFTQVLVKKDGRWLINAWHNTNITVVPGHPVPATANLPSRRG
jgi:uncharacterized protein (TIGR02246 family)